MLRVTQLQLTGYTQHLGQGLSGDEPVIQPLFIPPYQPGCGCADRYWQPVPDHKVEAIY